MSTIPSEEKLDEWLGNSPESEAAPAVTPTVVSLVAALRARAEELADCDVGSDEEAELAAVTDLLALYEAFATQDSA